MAYFYSLRGWLEAEPDNIDRLDENFMIANKKKCDYSDNLFKTNLVRNQWLNGRYILLMKSENKICRLLKENNHEKNPSWPHPRPCNLNCPGGNVFSAKNM